MAIIKKIIQTTFLVFISCCGFAQNKNIDVQHYQFNIAVNDSTNKIVGTAFFRFKNLKVSSQVYFDLTAINSKDQKGMRVSKVTEGGRPISFRQDPERVILNFSAPLKIDEQKEIRIDYAGIPEDGLIFSKNKFGKRTVFADNWPMRAHQWIPSNDHPSDKATVDFVITAPDHYQVVANGIKVEETNLENGFTLTHWKMEHPIATKVMAIGIADFSVQRVADLNCVPIETWVFTDNRKQGFQQYESSKNILPFFTTYIAPYPFKKLANVQSKTIFGGLENASNIFYSENSVIQDSVLTMDQKVRLEALMAHETAHQWFGDTVTEDDWPDLWLSEGFATYFADLYLENRYGEDFFKKRMNDERNVVIRFNSKRNTPVVDTTARKDPMQMLNPNSYQKGAWVLHMLRHRLGNEVFQKGIRAYYQDYKYKNASTSDLRTVLEKVSGTDLNGFFKQWVDTYGLPILKTATQYNGKTLTFSVKQTQPDLFEFPLTVEFSDGKNSVRKTFDISKSESNFKILMNFRPLTIKLDPEVNLLFEAAP